MKFVSKCVLINENNKFLSIKRTNYENNDSDDKWDIPGGKTDIENEDFITAVIREVREEVGLNIDTPKLLALFPYRNIKENLIVIISLYTLNVKKEIENSINLSEEHSEFTWISKEEINNYSFYGCDEIYEEIKKLISE